MRPQDDEFFIGYEPPMPPRIARFVREAILVIGLMLIVWAPMLAIGHVSVAAGSFEFDRPRTFSGTVVTSPYPALQPDSALPDTRPHVRRGEAELSRDPIPLLVAPGKHGADGLIRGIAGRHVTFTGRRIQRGAHAMLEVEPASLKVDGSAPLDAIDSLEQVTDEPIELTGEIVDSKCFLGVMVPGAGKTHKECASLCIRGGIPPALFVSDRTGHSTLLLVTGPNGESVRAQALGAAGEAMTVVGRVARQNGWFVIRTDPASWHPATATEE